MNIDNIPKEPAFAQSDPFWVPTGFGAIYNVRNRSSVAKLEFADARNRIAAKTQYQARIARDGFPFMTLP
jgi:hypothetical protein